ncbi:hypothetical protein DYQ86_01890 [Acidobacteria bacterium AB60]|nr:hypothetical protein DYQ86_01890 [Acidobacteria bacterium AB60]
MCKGAWIRRRITSCAPERRRRCTLWGSGRSRERRITSVSCMWSCRRMAGRRPRRTRTTGSGNIEGTECPTPEIHHQAIGRDYSMNVGELESVLLFVADLNAAKAFYVDLLGLPVLFEDGIVAVLRAGSGRVVLHRNDRGHDERGIFPVGTGATGVAVRFNVEDPDAWESEAKTRGLSILWKTQEASWGRFVVIGDPDGRPVVLAKMKKFG